MMSEDDFERIAARALDEIEAALGGVVEGLDYDLQAGGVIEIEFDDGTKMVINKHMAAQEIWVAAHSGGFHFRRDGDRWIGTRDGRELGVALAELIAAQLGTPISISLS